jgi:hypothetical protein
MRKMKTVVLRNGMLHVETPLGIVNITVGLHDSNGKRVDSIEVIPSNYAGEPKRTRDGYANTRIIEEQEGTNQPPKTKSHA